MYIVPGWELVNEQKSSTRQNCIIAVKQAAMSMKLLDLQFRKIMPRDLGLTDWFTPQQNGNNESRWIYQIVPTSCVIGIYKIAIVSRDTKVSILSFNRKKQNILDTDITEMFTVYPVIETLRENSMCNSCFTSYGRVDKLQAEGFFDMPIIYYPEEIIDIWVTSKEFNFGSEIVIVGFIAEPFKVKEVKEI